MPRLASQHWATDKRISASYTREPPTEGVNIWILNFSLPFGGKFSVGRRLISISLPVPPSAVQRVQLDVSALKLTPTVGDVWC
jgi:hypothetical protein